MNNFRLRNLTFFAKLGVTGVVLTFLIGLAASAKTMVDHYQNRDERPGLTKDDIVAAYSGLSSTAPLLTVMQEGHPGGVTMEIKPEGKATIIKWLSADRQNENYDNADFADPTPKEIMTASCVKCHSARAEDPKAKLIPLDNWEGVKKVAFTRKIERTPDRVKAISTHTHALSMATISVAIGAMALATSLPRMLIGILLGATGLGLCGDFAGWWLANYSAAWVNLIIGAGAVYNIGNGVLLVMILIDTWRGAEAGVTRNE